jgi:hypothetical protein
MTLKIQYKIKDWSKNMQKIEKGKSIELQFISNQIIEKYSSIIDRYVYDQVYLIPISIQPDFYWS